MTRHFLNSITQCCFKVLGSFDFYTSEEARKVLREPRLHQILEPSFFVQLHVLDRTAQDSGELDSYLAMVLADLKDWKMGIVRHRM